MFDGKIQESKQTENHKKAGGEAEEFDFLINLSAHLTKENNTGKFKG